MLEAGIFLSVISCIFLSKPGDISGNFFARTKILLRLRRGKYDFRHILRGFNTNQSFHVGIIYRRATGEENLGVSTSKSQKCVWRAMLRSLVELEPPDR